MLVIGHPQTSTEVWEPHYTPQQRYCRNGHISRPSASDPDNIPRDLAPIGDVTTSNRLGLVISGSIYATDILGLSHLAARLVLYNKAVL
jgi:hypothetical protein